MMASTSSLSLGKLVPTVPHRAFSRGVPRTPWTILLVVMLCLACQAMALAHAPEPTETLLIDTRVPVFEDGEWLLLSEDDVDLRRVKKRSTVKESVTTTFQIAVSTVTESPTTTTMSPSPLPSFLDGALAANFIGENGESSCPVFINSFLTDPTFRGCYPLSLLLQGSRSFFNAQKSILGITQVLDAACSPNVTLCNDYMQDVAQKLIAPENCGADYELKNTVVVDTYIAMQAYQPVYEATCTKDREREESLYCYAKAVTNTTTPSNVYFYYLALNLTLPGTTVPTCSTCLQDIMAIYQRHTANRNQPIALTYEQAATQVNTMCGTDFVNETLAAEVVSSGFSTASPSVWTLLLLWFLAAAPWLI